MAASKDQRKEKNARLAKSSLSSASTLANQRNAAEHNILRHKLSDLDHQRRRSIQAISNDEKIVLKELQHQGLSVQSDISRLHKTPTGHKQHLDSRRLSNSSNLSCQRDESTDTDIQYHVRRDRTLEGQCFSQSLDCSKFSPTQLSSLAGGDSDEVSSMTSLLNTRRKGSLLKSFSTDEKQIFIPKKNILDTHKQKNSSSDRPTDIKHGEVQISDLLTPVQGSLRNSSKSQIKQTCKKSKIEKLPLPYLLSEEKYREGGEFRNKNLEPLGTTSSRPRSHRGLVSKIPDLEMRRLQLRSPKNDLEAQLSYLKGDEEQSLVTMTYTKMKTGKNNRKGTNGDSRSQSNTATSRGQTIKRSGDSMVSALFRTTETMGMNGPAEGSNPVRETETSVVPCRQRRASVPAADRVLCKLIGQPHTDDTKAQWDDLGLYFEELRRKCQHSSPAVTPDQPMPTREDKSSEPQTQPNLSRRRHSEGSVVMLANEMSMRPVQELDPGSNRNDRHKLSGVPLGHPCFGWDHHEKSTSVQKLATVHNILQNSALSIAESESETL